ncbi:hypothetical protein ACLB2K_030925 [Fragaria x ananassa]
MCWSETLLQWAACYFPNSHFQATCRTLSPLGCNNDWFSPAPKSLLRFRCVCKAWRALISDPYFIRQHLSRANNSYYCSVLVKEISTFCSVLGSFVNGALHWVQEEPWEAEVDSYKLVSFDLTEEIFHEIPSPYYPNNPIDRCNHLVASAGKFRNSLALYSRGPGSEYMVWVMKEAGVEKSWNEVIKIPNEVLQSSKSQMRFCMYLEIIIDII